MGDAQRAPLGSGPDTRLDDRIPPDIRAAVPGIARPELEIEADVGAVDDLVDFNGQRVCAFDKPGDRQKEHTHEGSQPRPLGDGSGNWRALRTVSLEKALPAEPFIKYASLSSGTAESS